MSSWIDYMANRMATFDDVIDGAVKDSRQVNEALRTLSEEDVKKRSASTKFIDMWVQKETIEGDPENDEEDEVRYHMNGVRQMVIRHNEKYQIVLSQSRSGDSPIDLEKIVEDDAGYLKGCVMTPSWWEDFTEKTDIVKPFGSSIGYLLTDLCGNSGDEDAVDYIAKAQKLMSETFEYVKEYNAQGFTEYIGKNGIEVDERTGKIHFRNEILGGMFSITLIPDL